MNKAFSKIQVNNYAESGFIALTLTLAIAGLLLALTASNSLDSALFFDQAMRKEYRAMNYYFAGDCLDQAILNLAHDYFYTVLAPTEISRYHCIINSIIISGNQRIISTIGTYQNANVYRNATVLLYDHKLEVVEID